MTFTVLAIDDSPEVLTALKAWLRPERIELLLARDWEAGVALAAEHRPQLILLDVCMPDQSGLDVCRLLKSDPRTRSIPVIFLTAKTDLSTKLHGFDLGAADYVTKPFHPDELRARVRSALRQSQEYAALRREARVDPLTGLLNRASFDAEIEGAFAAALRNDHDLSIVLVDLDHFKSVNDRFGHPFGDLVLSRVGAALREVVRSSDFACRYGGEELALILLQADIETSLTVAERARARIAALPFVVAGERVPVTASFGVSSRRASAGDERDVEAGVRVLVRAADIALYEAKQRGRDRVCQPLTYVLPRAS